MAQGLGEVHQHLPRRPRVARGAEVHAQAVRGLLRLRGGRARARPRATALRGRARRSAPSGSERSRSSTVLTGAPRSPRSGARRRPRHRGLPLRAISTTPRGSASSHEAFDALVFGGGARAARALRAYRACKGEGMPATGAERGAARRRAVRRALRRQLFGVEAELEAFRETVRKDDPLWRFKQGLREEARAQAPTRGRRGRAAPRGAAAIAKAALQAMTAGSRRAGRPTRS